MRIGIIFPVVIFITAVVFLAWFFIGGYAAPGHKDEKNNDYYDGCGDYCRTRH
nr:YoaK family small membrane protein [Escherichia coli]